ncbi:MAG: family 78 glycoside hydrolase catalytic domain [Gloeobacteraceae cyanobacterium ES-bin-144]|nr:family 78 glycoside hydrolase catalytic domain [Verrucomicrobiales bacterium]
MKPAPTLSICRLFSLLFAVGLTTAHGLTPSYLRCEYLVDPLGIHEAAPRLSWVTESDSRGEKQTAYEVLVSSSTEKLAKNEGDLWASGKLASDDNAHVPYAGKPLISRQNCYWKTRVWDRDGKPGPWSSDARFEMGLLDASDWKAEWIEAPLESGELPTSLSGAKWIWHATPGADQTKGSPLGTCYFRYHFQVPSDTQLDLCALTITVDDSYTLSINGKEITKVGGKDSWRNPKNINLLPFITKGDNVIAVAATNEATAAGLCAKLTIKLPDKDRVILFSDKNWKTSDKAHANWTSISFDDQAWQPAIEIAPSGQGVWGALNDKATKFPVPMLRADVKVADKSVAKARLYATALGLMDFHVNGSRVGDQVLAPEWTDYRVRCRYQVYDITPLLRPGANVLAARLAHGWYSGRIGNGNYQFWGKSPALLAQLEVTYTDGSVERVVSDAGWRFAPSAITSSDFMLGEDYDARMDVADWSNPGLDDSSWKKAIVRNEAKRPLDPQVMEPARVVDELKAKSITESQPGKWVFDLGQNMVGVVRLKVAAPVGTKVTLRHAEILNNDGSMYLANLRGAPSIDTYICKGGGTETWQPAFTFHGFRYVELSGLPTKPALDAVTGLVWSSDTPQTGEFSCSDARLNQLQSNIWWGQRGNYLSVPTDCPQRDERLGWMGDAQVFVRTATGNADVAAFFTKWLVDVDDAQTSEGAYTDVSPRAGSSAGTPAWADAGVICPWTIYQAYGDSRLLESHYPNMARWVEWCRSHSQGLIRVKDRGADYGDWLSQGANTPKELIGTAYFAYSTSLVAQAAKALGKADDAAKYQQLFKDIKAAFNSKYVKPDGRIEGDTQSVYLMALKFGLLDGEAKSQAVQHLVADIAGKNNHLSTGFVGVSYLLPVLTANQQDDMAFKLLLQDSFPSWLFSVKHGATTIWERWDGWTPDKGFQSPSMNSFNHYSLGSCGEWMYDSLAGLGQDPSGTGWKHLIIHPRIGGGINHASYRLRTIRGTAASAWKIDNGQFILDCKVPVGSTATVVLPTAVAAQVLETKRPLTEMKEIRVNGVVDGKLHLTIESGTYQFSSPMP